MEMWKNAKGCFKQDSQITSESDLENSFKAFCYAHRGLGHRAGAGLWPLDWTEASQGATPLATGCAASTPL